MKKNMNSVLKKALEEIKPSQETVLYMQEELNHFMEKINKRIEKLKIDCEIFVGGSFAKDTLVKKGSYDVDLFLRFDEKYEDSEYLKLTKKILRRTKGLKVVHGSRDYFKVKVNPWFYFEVVPVKKVKSPKQSNNITDLSYSHVKYINKKIKSKKILDEIKLGKAFCSANQVYGAESYVHGFSGYAIELLIFYYKTFEKFLKETTKNKKGKIIIDIEKLYKNSKEVMFEMNGSKLLSPIILIDPTYKERNAAASLTDEVFKKFQKAAKDFLKNPTIEAFSPKKINLEEVKKNSKKKGWEFIELTIKTKKQEGDVAGTKLLKFYRHISFELSKYFEIKEEAFKYNKGREGRAYFVLKRKEFNIFTGPKTEDKKNSDKFKLEHPSFYEEKGRLYSKEKIEFSVKQFLKTWVVKNRKKIKQMYISRLNIK